MTNPKIKNPHGLVLLAAVHAYDMERVREAITELYEYALTFPDVCVACRLYIDDHVDGRCLTSPTRFFEYPDG